MKHILFLWEDSRPVDIVVMLVAGILEISFVAGIIWGIIESLRS
jgi:hypothetical protein